MQLKRIITLILSVCILLSIFPAVYAETNKLYLYVKNGAVGGDGSIDAPFGKWEEARDYIREIKKEGNYPSGGVVVYFREGIYNLSESVEFTSEDSGTAEAPIVYRSYMEEQVVFTGGVQIPLSDFTAVSDDIKSRLTADAAKNVKQLDLKSIGIHDYGELGIYGGGKAYYQNQGVNLPEAPIRQSPEFFLDDEVYTIARWPNDDYVLTGKIIQPGTQIEMYANSNKAREDYIPPEKRVYPPEPSIFEVEADTLKRMKTWQNPDDPWVYGYFKYDWSDVSLPVREIDLEKGIITTDWPSPKIMEKGKRFFFYNILEELDVPGEYYLDRQTGIVYVYPTKNSGNVMITLMSQPIVKMLETEHIRISGISFRAVREQSIALTNCHNVDIELCSISKVGGKAIIFYNCFDCSVVSCHIYECGTGGVYMIREVGVSGYDEFKKYQETLTPTNNRVENCEINDFARISKTYSAAVQAHGVREIIRNNKIYNSTHLAITALGPEAIVENNEFFNLLSTSDDSGAVYIGFSKTQRDIIIRNNYFHDMGSNSDGSVGIAAIYGDDLYDGMNIYGNVFENFAGMCVLINGGRVNHINNNIAINCNNFITLNPMGTYVSQEDHYAIGGFDFPAFLDNPAYAKYPHFTDLLEDEWMNPKYNVSENNIIVNCKEDIEIKTPQKITMDKIIADNEFGKSISFSSDPGFVNMEARNFVLKEDSKVYEKLPEFKAPDFMNMGMYTGRAKALMKDNVAYLLGSPKAYVGFVGKEINTDHSAVPFKENEIIYIPLRFTAEALGYQVNWDSATETVTLTDGTKITEVKSSDIKEINGVSFVASDWFNLNLSFNTAVYNNGIAIVGKEVKITSEDKNVLAELQRRLCNE